MNHLKNLALVALVLFAVSFKKSNQVANSHYKNDGYFTASIDGQRFDSRKQDKYTAELVNSKTDLTFFGNDYFDANGNVFQESLEFKYAQSAAGNGEVADQRIVFQFNNQKFLSVPGETKIHVTKTQLNADKTAMILSATFEGKMAQWVAQGQPQAIINVKGKMENISVSVPASSTGDTPYNL